MSSKTTIAVVGGGVSMMFLAYSVFSFIQGFGPIPIWPISEFVTSKPDPIIARLTAEVISEEITQFLKELSAFAKNNELELKSPDYDESYPSYYLAFYRRSDGISLLVDLKRSDLSVTWYSEQNNQQAAVKLALSMQEIFSQVHLKLDKEQQDK